MDDKDFATLAETVNGLSTCQFILFRLLVKDGILKREEIGLMLDSIIEGLNKQYPNNPNITKYLKDIREDINKASPLHFPDWLRDMLGEKGEGN